MKHRWGTIGAWCPWPVCLRCGLVRLKNWATEHRKCVEDD